MWYEINVSMYGVHYFATDKRSIQSRKYADIILDDLKKRFPENEGFHITMMEYTTKGKEIKQ